MGGESIRPMAEELIAANRSRHEERRKRGQLAKYRFEHFFQDDDWEKVWKREGLCGHGLASPDDVRILFDFFRSTFPPDEDNASLYQHLVDTAFYAVLIARGNGSQRPSCDLAVAAILRNSGSLTGEFEYFTKSLLSHVLMERLQIRDRVRSALMPLHMYLPPAANDERSFDTEYPLSIHNETLINDNAGIIRSALDWDQWTLEIAGLLAKRNDRGELMEPLDIHQLHLKSRADKDACAASIGQKKLVGAGATAAMNLVERSALSLSFSQAYILRMEDLRSQGVHLSVLQKYIHGREERAEGATPLDRSFNALMEIL